MSSIVLLPASFAVLLAGVAGLLAGLVWAPLGIAAVIGRVVCFAVAVAAHIRAHDLPNVGTPLAILFLAGAVLRLRLATIRPQRGPS